jgi:AraC family transcriptional regulator
MVMNAIDRALWYIESHFGGPIRLEDVASAVGLSRFQLSRLFTFVLGQTFTDYLRGRRLTEAARVLVNGAPDILSVALEAGYNSHEAFSRAFRAQFGATPEQVRARRNLVNLNLLEAIKMPTQDTLEIAAPEMRGTGPLLVAGMQRFFRYDDRGGIPTLWQRFAPHLGSIPGELTGATYGICSRPPSGDEDEGFDYLAGVAVRSLDDLPNDLMGMRIQALTWAVFQHEGHVSSIAETCAAGAEWLAREGRDPAEGPVQMIEFYGPQFDPRTGNGGCEVWMPVKD